MRKIHLAVGSLALAAALFGTSNASAQKQSQHGPGYVAGNVLGFSIISVGGTTVNLGPFGGVQTVGGGSSGAYHMDFEGGYHFGSGGHDGFVAAFRQGLYFFGGGFAASTQGKFGYAIPFEIKGGPMELVVEPYGILGAAYGDVSAAFAFGVGADIKFFFNDSGLFVGGHPLELGGWVSGGFVYNFAVGGGYAF